jgi:hypothetical protein
MSLSHIPSLSQKFHVSRALVDVKVWAAQFVLLVAPIQKTSCISFCLITQVTVSVHSEANKADIILVSSG